MGGMSGAGRRAGWALLAGAAIVWMAAAVGAASGAEVLLRDGRVLRGKLGALVGLADAPAAPSPDGSGPLQLILLLDDDLRRTFVSKRQVQQVGEEEAAQVEERFNIWQRAMQAGPTVKSVGVVMEVTPFDEFGRRNFKFNTSGGPVTITQGITELTPRVARVAGISHVWDMRIATSSIPKETLHRILLKQIDPKNVEHRKKVARFYLQCEMYEEARAELDRIAADFPDKRQELEPSIRALRQLAAQRLLAELKLRRSAGQHRLVQGSLKSFPSEGVAGEILQAVGELSAEYETEDARRKEVIERIDALAAQVADTATREQIEPLRREIAERLDLDTLPRMAAFRQAFNDADMRGDEKLALALSGWLVGADMATVKLPVALSLFRVRAMVRRYLNESLPLERDQILKYLKSEEAGGPRLVAALLAHMEPADPLPPPIAADRPGFYQLEVPVMPKEPPVTYLVQLPPEYNPLRRYPAIVTLRGAAGSAAQQIDWWAGAWTPQGWRAGQASRHGYIVIAPEWTAEHQRRYGYSAREHGAVLNALRDACRKFSIDTDRVFLSGHSMGGDAAWDIALAHPDLWAGAIPISARADKYCALYWENAQYVPLYVVLGELDGSLLVDNARDLDRYLRRGFACTVVEYLGRGHDHFYDEILRLFEWMGRLRRDFYPRDFTCATMRPWDNFFWWLEVDGLPPGSLVDPMAWPPPRGTQAASVSGKLTDNNNVYVRCGANRVTVWLSPRMVNLEQQVVVTVNGQRANLGNRVVEPDVGVLLEDVRTRGDRQHPFWAKIETPTGRALGTK